MRLKYTAERRKRWADLQSDPDLIEDVCAHVANGGTAIDLAETWDIPFGWLSNWLHEDKERDTRYRKALNDRAEWATESILRELRRLGLSDIRKLYDDNGNLKPPHDWPTEMAAAVAGVETIVDSEGDVTKKVKLWPKDKSLELLGKNLRLFVDRVEHGLEKKLEDIIADSMGSKSDEPEEN